MVIHGILVGQESLLALNAEVLIGTGSVKVPEIGEVKQGQAIGKAIWRAHIWQACPDCGKERWVQLIKGKPDSLRCVSCNRLWQIGVNHPRWNGGRYKLQGYIVIRLFPNDFFSPMANARGYVFEHRLVVAKALGRCLQIWEIIHHKHTKYPAGSIEDKQDNRRENLQLVTDDRHKQITIMERRIKKLETKVEGQSKLIKLLRWQGNKKQVAGVSFYNSPSLRVSK